MALVERVAVLQMHGWILGWVHGGTDVLLKRAEGKGLFSMDVAHGAVF